MRDKPALDSPWVWRSWLALTMSSAYLGVLMQSCMTPRQGDWGFSTFTLRRSVMRDAGGPGMRPRATEDPTHTGRPTLASPFSQSRESRRHARRHPGVVDDEVHVQVERLPIRKLGDAGQQSWREIRTAHVRQLTDGALHELLRALELGRRRYCDHDAAGAGRPRCLQHAGDVDGLVDACADAAAAVRRVERGKFVGSVAD